MGIGPKVWENGATFGTALNYWKQWPRLYSIAVLHGAHTYDEPKYLESPSNLPAYPP
jgi:hypothetical protein